MLMKQFIGYVLLIGAIIGGFYVGGWLFFFKAIVDIIEAVKVGFLVKEIVISVCKIVIGVPVTAYVAYIMGLIGLILLFSDN